MGSFIEYNISPELLSQELCQVAREAEESEVPSQRLSTWVGGCSRERRKGCQGFPLPSELSLWWESRQLSHSEIHVPDRFSDIPPH